MVKTIKPQRALIIPGCYSKLLMRYAKAVKIEIIGKTQLEYIFDDVLFHGDINIILYARETTFEEMYEIKREFPFRFIFVSPDEDQILDTKYLPTYTDVCAMLKRLKEDHSNMSWNSIRKLLNDSGVKPLPPMRASKFSHKNMEYVLYKICKLGKKEDSH